MVITRHYSNAFNDIRHPPTTDPYTETVNQHCHQNPPENAEVRRRSQSDCRCLTSVCEEQNKGRERIPTSTAI